MRTLLLCLAVVGLCVGFMLKPVKADDAEKPKHTIKEVMKVAHKGGLLKKVLSGNASDEEEKQLCELYESLAANKPPKGDPASWKAKTSAVLSACKSGDLAALKKATNCAACHKAHKGS